MISCELCRRLVIALAALAVPFVATNAAAAPTWLAPVALSGPGLFVEPDLALSLAGEALVVWDHEVGDVCGSAPDNPACMHVLETRSRRPGGVWSPPLELARPGVGPGPRAAVNDAGDSAVVWRHDIGADRVLQASFRRNPFSPWPEPIDLSEAGAIPGQDVELDAAGNVTAAWWFAREAQSVAQTAGRSVASGIWGPPLTLSGGGAVVGPPALAVNASGQAVSVWARVDGAVQASFRPGALAAWEPPVVVSPPGAEARPGMDVAINEAGDAAAIWAQHPTGGSVDTIHAAYRPRGGPWVAPAEVSPEFAVNPAHPRVRLDREGNAVAAWLNESLQVEAAARPRSGGWSHTEVSPVGVLVDALDLAVDPAGNAVAVWTSGNPGGQAPQARAALRPGASGSWLPPVEISTTAPAKADPHVAIDAAGRAVAIWRRIGPGESTIEAAELAVGGPVLSNLAVPERAGVGRPVTFSVDSAPWGAPLALEPGWLFGDGTATAGGRVSHVYRAPGRYVVTVSQADASGAVTRASATIEVSTLRNAVRPSIRGRPVVGAALACLPGTWRGVLPIRYAFRWLRNGRAIPAARNPRYRVRAGDRGALVACRVEAANPVATARAVSRPVRIRRR